MKSVGAAGRPSAVFPKLLLGSGRPAGRPYRNCNLRNTIKGKAKLMSQVTYKGNPINTAAELPKIGSNARDFTVVKTDLS